MLANDQYEAIDFGENRRLERFGKIILDRPCPAALNFRKKSPSFWTKADAVFQIDENSSKKSNTFGQRGKWLAKTDLGRSLFSKMQADNSVNSLAWQIRHDQAVFELQGTPFGHVGIFPEQAENWDAIKAFCLRHVPTSHDVASKTATDASPSFRVLNLFAYTGGSTLAAVQGGAEIVHVDAASNVVGWARKNAELSRLPQTSVRWIVEDAQKFVRRELKRGNTYQGVILDPPSYGHGAHGEVWRLSRQLPDLLFDCFSLLESKTSCFVLLTCHTPGFSLNRLTHLIENTAKEAFGDGFARNQMQLNAKTMTLRAESGAVLPSGESVMFCYNDT